MEDKNLREYTILVISGTLVMLSGGVTNPIFAPYAKQEFVASLFLVGVAVSSYFLVRMFSELPFGAISDRIGVRKLLVLGRLFAIIGSLISWLATDILQLIIARALWGIGDAAFFCIATSYISSLFSSQQRGRALGIFSSIEMIGSFLGQSIGGMVAGTLGFRTIFLLSTILCVVSFFLTNMVQGNSSQNGQPDSASSSVTTIRAVINSTVLIACFMNFSLMLRNNGIFATLIPIYLTEDLQIPFSEYGILIASSTAGSAIGASLGGIVSDRFGRKKILVFGFGLGVVATYALALVKTFVPFLPVMIVNGFFWGIIYSVTPVLVADSVPNNVRGMAIGMYRSFFDFGGLIGPIVMSVIAEQVGLPYGYIVAFYVGAALMVVNLVPIVLLKPTKKVTD